MASNISSLEPTSPFVTYATQATRGVLISMLRIVAMNYNATPNEAFNAYFDGSREAEKILGFKQLLNGYIQTCCKEYLTIYQQIVDKKLEKSDINEDNLTHYAYYTLEKIISQNDDYKHINCIFDALMACGILQFQYVFKSITQTNISMGGTGSSRGGNFNYAETNIIRYFLQQMLDTANKEIYNSLSNSSECTNIRFKCDEDNSCGLKIEDEKQRQEQQRQIIEQEAKVYECPCEHHKH